MGKKKKGKVAKVRNRFAIDPIMKKGGVHEKTTKAKRKLEKQQIKRELKLLPFSVLWGQLFDLFVDRYINPLYPYFKFGNLPKCTVTS